MTRRVEDWRYSAACQNQNPELFFGGGDGEAALSQVAQAKRVCSQCPVRQPCLNWAVVKGEQHGVWGGLSESERRTDKRRRAGQHAETV